MSSALAKAAPLKPEIRLAQALSRLEADLTPEQKAIFQRCKLETIKSPPTIQDVMRFTAHLDRQAARKFGSTRCFGPRLTNILQAVQQFAGLGGLMLGNSQNILAAGLWSMICLTFDSFIKLRNDIDQITTYLMTFGRSAPRFENLALLYPQSKHLSSFLTEYYIILVDLSHKLLKLTNQPVLHRLPFAKRDLGLDGFKPKLEAWSEAISKEMSILMAQDLRKQSSRLAHLVKSRKSEAHRENLAAYHKLLEACSRYDEKTTWKEIRKAGHASFFEDMQEYVDWKTAEEASTLLCSGKLGSGKSVLLANVIDNLNLHSGPNHSVCYFFCRYDVAESLMARTIIGSLARQLIQYVKDYQRLRSLTETIVTPLGLSDITELLLKVLPINDQHYFVLDGLDECDESERQAFLDQLQLLQPNLKLKVCMSFRSDVWPSGSPEVLWHTGTITIPENNPDIEHFIDAQLETCLLSKKLVIGRPELIVQIRDALLGGSQGMFLWVVLQIEALCDARTDDEICRALKDLPKNLPETFSRILNRSLKQAENMQIPILEFIAAACRPLTTDELAEALSVVPGDTTWNPARLPNDMNAVLSCCGSLIYADEETLTVRLFHHSVKQYLLGEFSGCNNPIFTRSTANARMAATSVTYLNFNVFDTQLSTNIVPNINAENITSKIIQSVKPPDTILNLALRLLKLRKGGGNVDVGAVLTGMRQNPITPTYAFSFLNYAKPYYLEHACAITEKGILLALLNQVIGDEDAKMSCQTDQGLLQKAVELDNIGVVEMLSSKTRGFQIESSFDEILLRSLLCATKNNALRVTKYLANVTLHSENISLHLRCAKYAAERKRIVLLDTIFEDWMLQRRSSSETTSRLLLKVIDKEEPLVAEELISYFPQSEIRASFDSAMILAVQGGSAPVVRALLENSGDIVKNSILGTGNFIRAAAEHQKAGIVKLLLQHGAPIDAKYICRQTLDHKSHEKIMDFLAHLHRLLPEESSLINAPPQTDIDQVLEDDLFKLSRFLQSHTTLNDDFLEETACLLLSAPWLDPSSPRMLRAAILHQAYLGIQ